MSLVIEGRRIDTKSTAEPFGGWSQERHERDAVRGSRMLRDAIWESLGLEIPPVVETRPKQITRAEVHKPEKCPLCGAPKQPNRLLIAHIQATVASYYGLHISAMTSQRQSHDIAHPRQVAMYLASELTDKSVAEIGRRFGGRDHTTVLYAIRAVKNRIAADPEIAVDVAALRESLEG